MGKFIRFYFMCLLIFFFIDLLTFFKVGRTERIPCVIIAILTFFCLWRIQKDLAMRKQSIFYLEACLEYLYKIADKKIGNVEKCKMMQPMLISIITLGSAYLEDKIYSDKQKKKIREIMNQSLQMAKEFVEKKSQSD